MVNKKTSPKEQPAPAAPVRAPGCARRRGCWVPGVLATPGAGRRPSLALLPPRGCHVNGLQPGGRGRKSTVSRRRNPLPTGKQAQPPQDARRSREKGISSTSLHDILCTARITCSSMLLTSGDTGLHAKYRSEFKCSDMCTETWSPGPKQQSLCSIQNRNPARLRPACAPCSHLCCLLTADPSGSADTQGDA